MLIAGIGKGYSVSAVTLANKITVLRFLMTLVYFVILSFVFPQPWQSDEFQVLLDVAIGIFLVAGLLEGPRLPAEAFRGTAVALAARGALRDVLTGEERQVRDGKLLVDELFSTLPIALLTGQGR